jgi:hypothetical protein
MNIPLDQLYHYIQNVAEQIHNDRVIIYRFYPYGSKNINDLNNLEDFDCKDYAEEWLVKTICPSIWCNDQEPLDHEFYSKNLREWHGSISALISFLKSNGLYTPSINLNYRRFSIFNKHILLHSEQRSDNLKKYEADNELIPVYYWSHAVIARDWFRYAEHETFQKNIKKTFLIYNRAWSNTREYRLKFSDLLIENNLAAHCQTTCNTVDPELGIYYDDYCFKNTQWKPNNKLENFFSATAADSTSSAVFDTKNYNSTDIEVVLETLFDDSRLHLTEKTLRPIACGQPFILVGTHGSLEYLRNYGFKTFGDIWDETYDLIENPKDRLIQIVSLMRQIADWDTETKHKKMQMAQQIVDYNRQRFFSPEFFNQVIGELKTNLTEAFIKLTQHDNYKIDYWRQLASTPAVIDFLSAHKEIQYPTKSDIDFILDLLKTKHDKL